MDVGRRDSRVDGVARQDGELVRQRAVGKHRHVPSSAPLGVRRDVGQVLQDGTHPPGRGDAVRAWSRRTAGPQRNQPVGQTPQLAFDVVPAGRSPVVGRQSLPRRIASRRRISRYSHTRVTTSPKAAIQA